MHAGRLYAASAGRLRHNRAVNAKPYSVASARNREPILEQLHTHFADRRHVLEIGGGTGQHAAHFAAALRHLVWQTSDRAENLDGIRLWLDEAALPNTPEPIELDVTKAWPDRPFDALFSANTLHIMAWPEVEAMFARLPSVTTADAKLAIYGPFNYDGRFSSDSNAAFDASLRARAPHMGIRDAADVDSLAERAGFVLHDDIAMPANNRLRLWQRDDS